MSGFVAILNDDHSQCDVAGLREEAIWLGEQPHIEADVAQRVRQPRWRDPVGEREQQDGWAHDRSG